MTPYNNLSNPYRGQQNTFQPPAQNKQIVFDYKKAREAGLDDTQIFQHLSEQKAKGVNIVIDKNDIASYHDNPVQEDKPNYNVFKPASPDAGFAEKAVRGVGNFITNLSGKFGGALEGIARAGANYLGGAGAAIPAALDPKIENIGKTKTNFLTGDQVKPWFSGNADTKTEQTFTQGAGEILQHGAEIAPWLMGGGEAKAIANAGETAANISKLRKAALIAKASVPLATGIGVSGGLRETGSQMQTSDYNVPKILGTTAQEALYGLGGEILFRGGASLLGKGASKGLASSEISKNVADAVDKALKPSLSGVKTPAMRSAYYKNADTVFETIHNLKPEFKDINGEVIKGRNPQTLYEMAQSFPNAKQTIFNEYDNIATKSGQQGAQFNPQPIIDKLKTFSEDVSHSPEIRAYAAKKAESLAELQGASPKVIQSRIAELNKGLDGLQLGTERPRLEVDASIAGQLRKNLDQLIEQTTGESYAPLKKLYGSFSAIENDLNRAVNNYLRKSGSGLPGITDIFTGGDITAGILTANPALIAKGVAGKGIKEYITWFTNPNRYIKKAFQSFEGVPERTIRIKPTEPITNPSQLLESPKSIRLKPKTDNSRLLSQAEAQAQLDGYKKKGEIKLLKAPLGDKTNPIILKSPKKVPLIKNNAETAVLSKLAKKSVNENPLFTEARKYKSADEFVKAQPKLYHSGTADITAVDTGKSNFQKTFYLSDNADYAKSFGGKNSTINEMSIDAKANLADMRNPSPELVSKIESLLKRENAVFSDRQIVDGIKAGKAHFAELPEVKKALKELGFDGQITSEVPYAKNIGVWNKDVVKTKSQLTDIYNQATKKKILITKSPKTDTSYKIQHQISDGKSASSLTNLDDIVQQHKVNNGYLTKYDLADLGKLKKLQGNPTQEVTIYRASPLNELNDGDWVTTSKTYANDIKKQNGGKVYEYTVKAGDLIYPNDITELPSLARFSAFKYSPRKILLK